MVWWFSLKCCQCITVCFVSKFQAMKFDKTCNKMVQFWISWSSNVFLYFYVVIWFLFFAGIPNSNPWYEISFEASLKTYKRPFVPFTAQKLYRNWLFWQHNLRTLEHTFLVMQCMQTVASIYLQYSHLHACDRKKKLKRIKMHANGNSL